MGGQRASAFCRVCRNDEVNVNADYTIGRFITLAGYIDYKRYQQSQLSSTGGTGSPVPRDVREGWGVEQQDKAYDFVIFNGICIIPKRLTLMAQYDNVLSNGNADLTYLATAFPGSTPAGFYNKITTTSTLTIGTTTGQSR